MPQTSHPNILSTQQALADLEKNGQQFDALLSEAKNLVVKYRDAYNTVLPLLRTLGWFDDKCKAVFAFLRQDLADTENR